MITNRHQSHQAFRYKRIAPESFDFSAMQTNSMATHHRDLRETLPHSQKLTTLVPGHEKTGGHIPFRVCDLRPSQFENRSLWAKGDLNPHVRKGHWHLKPARLPFRHSPVGTNRTITPRANTPPNPQARARFSPLFKRLFRT